MMNEQVCLRCRYFSNDVSDPTYGQCRRNAPTPVLGRDDDNSPVPARHVWWPIVYIEDYCGEWQAWEASE
jgi:hypothetical protein